MSTLYAIPAQRRVAAGIATGVLALTLLTAGLAPIVSEAPAWLRISGVLLFLVGTVLGLICVGFLNSVRMERAHRRNYEAQIAADRAAAQILTSDDCAVEGDAQLCGGDACAGACSLAALRRS